MNIGIIGAGHAGVAAAQIATDAGHEITLFSNENCLPYFRPRIPAIAFGQLDKEKAVMHPKEWYKNHNIDLKLNEAVQKITPDRKIINQTGKEYRFDKIIISSGAIPIIPPFSRNCRSDAVIPLWTMQNAQTISSKLGTIKSVVIIGGGVIGIEAALRAVDAGLEVSIIERNNYLMERNLSNKASDLVSQMLKKRGITIYAGHTVEEINDCVQPINVATDKKKDITTDLVVLSIGNTFNLKFVEASGLKSDRGIVVSKQMQTSNKSFFAAGDIAQLPDIINVCSAMKATLQGKIAGKNAVNFDKEKAEYKIEPIGVLLKYQDFQLYAIGEKNIDNMKEDVLEDTSEIHRALIKKDGKIIGIQMVGSLTDHKKYEKEMGVGY